MSSRIPYVLLAAYVVSLVVAVATAKGATATASAYSTADSPGTQGCDGRPLRDDTLTFAALMVPCGARVRFCVRGRCVVATRADSGPYVHGRSFDLALGTVRALGFRGVREFGVRSVTWRRIS